MGYYRFAVFVFLFLTIPLLHHIIPTEIDTCIYTYWSRNWKNKGSASNIFFRSLIPSWHLGIFWGWGSPKKCHEFWNTPGGLNLCNLGGGNASILNEFHSDPWGNDPIWRSHIFWNGQFNHQLVMDCLYFITLYLDLPIPSIPGTRFKNSCWVQPSFSNSRVIPFWNDWHISI